MNFSVKIQDFLKNILPSPFSIAVLLTAISFLLAFFLSGTEGISLSHAYNIVSFWEKGFWELLAFSTQMMLILVLGHTLALTPTINRFISIIINFCTTNAKAALIVTA
jgi:short-chain fatty acids transporter